MNQAAHLASVQFDADALHHAYLSSVDADLPAVLVELDLADRQALALFGSRVQERLIEIAGRMLEGVRAEDTGKLVEVLRGISLKLQAFEASSPDHASQGGWLDRLLGRSQLAAEPLQHFEKALAQIEALSTEVYEHRRKLLTGIESSDRLYEAGFAHLRELERYVGAAEFNLAEVDAHLAVSDTGDADVPQDLHAERRTHDLHVTRDNLRRRLRDLRIAAQVTRQTLSSVCLMQENDEALVEEISSTLTHALAAWRKQLARAITSNRFPGSAGNANVVELSNGWSSYQEGEPFPAKQVSREQGPHGVFDKQLVSEANRELLQIIEDQLRVAKDGQAARRQARQELSFMEQELRWALSAATVNQQVTQSFV